MVEIPVIKAAAKDLKKKPEPGTELGFGKNLQPHYLFMMDYEKGAGWKNPHIEPYRALSLDPAALVLHYGQEVFEGLKAYRWSNGDIYLFRPRMNYERMNRSARRLACPGGRGFGPGGYETVRPAGERMGSLSSRVLSLHPAELYRQRAALGYRFPSDSSSISWPARWEPTIRRGSTRSIFTLPEKYIRAARGGLGEAKTLANYAASLLAQEEAHEEGFTQVLWLDAVERKYVEEVGTSNIFFYIGDELVTPPLAGTFSPE